MDLKNVELGRSLERPNRSATKSRARRYLLYAVYLVLIALVAWKWCSRDVLRYLERVLATDAGLLQHSHRRPNFIFILTDDQDLLMDSVQYQPAVQRHFAREGTFFSKHYCTISICCPSRVSLLTGKAAHKYEAYADTLRQFC